MTGQLPYHEIRSVRVMDTIIEGKHPKRPWDTYVPGATRKLWQICERCWKLDPNKRLKIEDITKELSFIDPASLDKKVFPLSMLSWRDLVSCVTLFWVHVLSMIPGSGWNHARKSIPSGRAKDA